MRGREDPGDSPVALKLTRAVADTYPRAVPAGTPLFIVGTFFGTDQVERVDGEEVAGYGLTDRRMAGVL